MTKADIEQKVALHYSPGDLTRKILATLNLDAAAPGSVPVESLFPVDQLHHGGVGLTKYMAHLAGVTSQSKVLDAGSGIGGAARFLATQFDCTVAAIDLSDDFVRTAADLDTLVGVQERITHRQGSVTELPFDDNSFDIVWCQNVTMNVEDKQAMFAEAYRVLRSGGTYVLTHIAKTTDGELTYPMPWAMTAETSFVTPPDTFLHWLREAGFQDITDHGVPAPAAPPSADDPQPLDSVAMGDDMPTRRANTSRAVQAGQLKTMTVIARR